MGDLDFVALWDGKYIFPLSQAGELHNVHSSQTN